MCISACHLILERELAGDGEGTATELSSQFTSLSLFPNVSVVNNTYFAGSLRKNKCI